MRLRRLLSNPPTLRAYYTLIPLYTPSKASNGGDSDIEKSSGSSRRSWLGYAGIVMLFVLFMHFVGFMNAKIAVVKFVLHTLGSSPLPPTFEEYYAAERAYPQHNLSLSFPGGVNGRYVWFSNQHYGEYIYLSAVRVR